MIVCHCRVVSDRAIRAATDDVASVDEIAQRCGAAQECGACLTAVVEVVDQARGDNGVEIRLRRAS